MNNKFCETQPRGKKIKTRRALNKSRRRSISVITTAVKDHDTQHMRRVTRMNHERWRHFLLWIITYIITRLDSHCSLLVEEDLAFILSFLDTCITQYIFLCRKKVGQGQQKTITIKAQLFFYRFYWTSLFRSYGVGERGYSIIIVSVVSVSVYQLSWLSAVAQKVLSGVLRVAD